MDPSYLGYMASPLQRGYRERDLVLAEGITIRLTEGEGLAMPMFTLVNSMVDDTQEDAYEAENQPQIIQKNTNVGDKNDVGLPNNHKKAMKSPIPDRPSFGMRHSLGEEFRMSDGCDLRPNLDTMTVFRGGGRLTISKTVSLISTSRQQEHRPSFQKNHLC